jgi:hypothetical protein
VREAHDAVRHQARMLQGDGVVRDHSRDEDLALGQPGFLPDTPLVLVPRLGGLDRIAGSYKAPAAATTAGRTTARVSAAVWAAAPGAGARRARGCG